MEALMIYNTGSGCGSTEGLPIYVSYISIFHMGDWVVIDCWLYWKGGSATGARIFKCLWGPGIDSKG